MITIREALHKNSETMLVMLNKLPYNSVLSIDDEEKYVYEWIEYFDNTSHVLFADITDYLCEETDEDIAYESYCI